MTLFTLGTVSFVESCDLAGICPCCGVSVEEVCPCDEYADDIDALNAHPTGCACCADLDE